MSEAAAIAAGITWLSFTPAYSAPRRDQSARLGAHAFRDGKPRSICGFVECERAGGPADDAARNCVWCLRVIAGVSPDRSDGAPASARATADQPAASVPEVSSPAPAGDAPVAAPAAAAPVEKLCARCHMRPALAGRPGPYRCTECAAKPAPRERRRRYRDNLPRARTIGRAELAREVQMHAAVDPPPPDVQRPATRAECRDMPRPCPWVGCRHHLAIEVNPENGTIKLNHPDREPWELKETCALDVAERGGITLEEVAELINLTRERVRQVEVSGLLKIKMASPSPDEVGARRLPGARASEVLP